MSIAIESSKIGFLQSVTPFGFDPGLRSRIRENPPFIPLFAKGERGGFETRNLKPDTRNQLMLIRLDSADQSVRKTALDVHMVAVAVPREVPFLQPFRQFRRFCFQLLSGLQPVLARGDTVHSFLIERIR